jgi:hypothetical protein
MRWVSDHQCGELGRQWALERLTIRIAKFNSSLCEDPQTIAFVPQLTKYKVWVMLFNCHKFGTHLNEIGVAILKNLQRREKTKNIDLVSGIEEKVQQSIITTDRRQAVPYRDIHHAGRQLC